ncbi:MAG: glycosyl hydrolase [Saprospiraceae bacterium]|nr:glycosyl hydrolase [Saprospiraceae bacterium]
MKQNTIVGWVIGLCMLMLALKDGQAQAPPLPPKEVPAISMRSVGPALMGGRIADIAVSPEDPSTWYVAVGSGGVWKTTNRGTTWQPIFDDQPSYSIGTLALDPNDPSVIWVGTGENVSGRHVGWGDGVYRSGDGGQTWAHMGLKRSEHIGRILVDPRNSDVVLVAAEGPLWSSGGQRGLYRTGDGGKTWVSVLEIDEHTGITDIEFNPSNPDVIYAAAYQRRRHTWSLLGGGPSSGIYRSDDGGESWHKMTTGLPKGDVGKIGLAVTESDPQRVYATIEADTKEKGFYRSLDGGRSWQKRNAYISGGTGPHYYQEIEASPTNPDLVYQMDVFLHVTRDGGDHFDYLGTGREKHSDNHALWIDPKDGKHLLAGTDGGLYETFDEGESWRHFPNLPISQFYKLALDNALPFYNIVGGAQDLGTLLGPSRTANTEGIRNQDWYVPLGADGYECAFDPTDPNTVYMEIQQGVLYRHDRRTEEGINIKPQPAVDDPPERWNWDSPFLISPHDPDRLYFGSQRLWQSDDQGTSWRAISHDLTTNTSRYTLELMDRVWSVDALYDNGAMSKYATLTAIEESSLAEGLLYTGSDDGLLHISENGGDQWRAGGDFPGVPTRSFINDVQASVHDANVVFVAVDAHKFGDYSPYLFMSQDRGATWKSIAGDLPQGTIVWVIKQDHVDENLLFLGAEDGLYFSLNGGANWQKWNKGVPTISFRDIELHQRDDDLVGATFGRGFYIIDDYSYLRHLESGETKGNVLFPIRDSWWYIPHVPMQAKGMPGQGSTRFRTKNPPFGALLTYQITEVPSTKKEARMEREKSLRATEEDVPVPSWEALEFETEEQAAQILFLIRDGNEEPIRWLEGSTQQGIHRLHWDLRYAAPHAISLVTPDFVPPWVSAPEGPQVGPGTYSAQMYLAHAGSLSAIGDAQEFEVKPVPSKAALPNLEEAVAFQKETAELWRLLSGANRHLEEVGRRLQHLKAALLRTPGSNAAHHAALDSLRMERAALRSILTGSRSQQRLSEASKPSIASRVGQIMGGHWTTHQLPTLTHRASLQTAWLAYEAFREQLLQYDRDLEAFEADLVEAGAPWTPGRKF